jgi:septum formation protein
MSNRTIVLASASRHRRALLERAGLGAVRCVAPASDETIDEPGLAPVELVTRLAERKARSVAAAHPDALVIGCDQVAEVDGRVLGKPGTAERAVEQLLALAGREHRLLTGLCVHEPATGRSELALDVHRMTMWPLDRTRLERYVAIDQPLDCAGSYRVEAAGIALFESMAGEDFTAIVGLPLCLLAGLLGRFGVTMLDIVV